MHFAPFFFFFFEFWPELAVSVDTARVGPILRELARVGAASTRVGASRLKTRGIHMARRGGTRGQRCPRLVAASCRVRCGCGTSGAASVFHRFELREKKGE